LAKSKNAQGHKKTIMSNKKNNTENKEMEAPKKDTGFVHKSVNKSKPDSPDYFGRMDIHGSIFVLAGWAKTGKDSDENFIQINFDLEGLDKDEQTKLRKDNLDNFKAARKLPENKDKFLLIEATGTLHKAQEDKKEDFFGTVLLNGQLVSLIGFAMTGKKGAYVMLKVASSLQSKEERTKISNDFM